VADIVREVSRIKLRAGPRLKGNPARRKTSRSGAGMDGHNPKSIRTEGLQGEISAPAPAAGFSISALLDRLDQDRELLKELIEIFRQEFPRYKSEVQDAVAKRDLKRVSASGHALKGMFANLAAERAAELAGHLERLAKNADSESLPVALKALEDEFSTLLPMLDSSLVEARG